MRLTSQKLYKRQLWEDQIGKPNVLKLGHWKNFIVVDYTKKNAKKFFNNLKLSNMIANQASLMWRWGVQTYIDSSGKRKVIVTFLS